MHIEAEGSAGGNAQRSRRRLLAAAKLLAGVAVLAVLAWRVDLDRVRMLLASVDPRPLAASLAVFAATVVLHAWRWRALLRFWRIETGFGTLARLILGAGALNLVLPGNLGGDAYRVYGTRRPAAGLLPSAGLVVLERYCGFLATFGLALVAIAASDFAARQPGLTGGVIALFAVFLVPAVLAASGRAAAVADRALRRLGLTRSAAALAGGAAAFRAFVGAPRLVVGVVALSVAMKACMAAILALLALGLGLRLRWTDLLVFLPLHTVVSALPLTLNGLGLREANLVAVFTRLGLTAEQATSLAFLHLIWLYATALPGALLLLRRSDPSGGGEDGPAP